MFRFEFNSIIEQLMKKLLITGSSWRWTHCRRNQLHLQQTVYYIYFKLYDSLGLRRLCVEVPESESGLLKTLAVDFI